MTDKLWKWLDKGALFFGWLTVFLRAARYILIPLALFALALA
jgi:hypothetical protein